MSTTISWTGETWPIVVGCDQISPGCKHCYAMRSVHRVNLMQLGCDRPAPYDKLVELVQLGGRKVPRWTGEVGFFPDKLSMPLRWREPRKIFVASQGDVFHDGVTNEQIAAIFGVMAACPRHTFQILTKRPARMRAWFRWYEGDSGAGCSALAATYSARELGVSIPLIDDDSWPLPNVWIGVSAEDQQRADERIPELLEVPAAVRFVSAEPLLSRVSLWEYLRSPARDRAARIGKPEGAPIPPGLDWVIAGCESGPGARPCTSDWLRALRDEVVGAGAAFFLKQARGVGLTAGEGSHRKGGGVIELPYLDGEQHAAFPAVAA